MCLYMPETKLVTRFVFHDIIQGKYSLILSRIQGSKRPLAWGPEATNYQPGPTTLKASWPGWPVRIYNLKDILPLILKIIQQKLRHFV